MDGIFEKLEKEKHELEQNNERLTADLEEVLLN